MRLDIGGVRGTKVLGQHDLLVTAVRNLLDNAVAYSGEASHVGVGVRTEGDLVEIAVVDEGIGITPAEQERVFERFYRVDPARSRDTGGTGWACRSSSTSRPTTAGTSRSGRSRAGGRRSRCACPARKRSGPAPSRRCRQSTTKEQPCAGARRDPDPARRGRGVLPGPADVPAGARGLRRRHRRHRAGGAPAVRRVRGGPRAPRPHAPGPARHRGLPPPAAGQRRPGHHAHRQGRRDRQGGRPGARGRRLRDQAVLVA